MKLFALLLGITIALIALFISFQISPIIGNMLLTPILFFISSFDGFIHSLPTYIQAFLIFASVLFFFLVFFFFSKLFLKNLSV